MYKKFEIYKKNINYRILLKIKYGTTLLNNTIKIYSPYYKSISDAKIHGIKYCDIHNTFNPIISANYYINYTNNNKEYIQKININNRKCSCVIS